MFFFDKVFQVDERPPNLISNSNDSQIQVEFAYLKKQHEALLDKFKKSEELIIKLIR